MKQNKTFNLIDCSGSCYEIGYQYGKTCQDNIKKSFEGLMNGLCLTQKTDRNSILMTARKYLPGISAFDPNLIEMIKGEADGSGLSFDEILTLKCGTELNFYYRRLTTLCTSFAVRGHATRNGETIIGQTYDFAPGTTLDLVRRTYLDGLKQLSLVVGAGIGGEVILNSAGLGMALNIVVSPETEQLINQPFSCVISKAMRQKRIGDALGVVCSSGRSILYYAFASHEGDIIGVETWPNDFNVIYPENDILLHTNHALTERFKRGNGAYGFMEGDSHIRLQRLRRLMENHYGEITTEIAMDFLCDHTDYPRSICKHIADGVALGETIAAIIIEPEQKTMYLSYGQPCSNEFTKYTL